MGPEYFILFGVLLFGAHVHGQRYNNQKQGSNYPSGSEHPPNNRQINLSYDKDGRLVVSAQPGVVVQASPGISVVQQGGNGGYGQSQHGGGYEQPYRPPNPPVNNYAHGHSVIILDKGTPNYNSNNNDNYGGNYNPNARPTTPPYTQHQSHTGGGGGTLQINSQNHYNPNDQKPVSVNYPVPDNGPAIDNVKLRVSNAHFS